ncbi:hypothetical protein KK062_03740 [Fulvivirgaceae bacterium PWU5]|uniref:Uncharacterized protein n=1 Tax=Dawidia cretensis TaxID=2782350 RepID=A0AAP2DU74_9BACT|nr:hypothetical protein [Dawidia cretensis]MBT1707316.1 hypothetical protein [Dawidia cretensis]
MNIIIRSVVLFSNSVRISLFSLLSFAYSSCVVMPKSSLDKLLGANKIAPVATLPMPNDDTRNFVQQVKVEINRTLLAKSPEMTCSLDFLLPLLAKHMSALSELKVHDARLNLIKNDLVNAYREYDDNRSRGKVAVLTEQEMLFRLDAYLNHMIFSYREPISFWGR